MLDVFPGGAGDVAAVDAVREGPLVGSHKSGEAARGAGIGLAGDGGIVGAAGDGAVVGFRDIDHIGTGGHRAGGIDLKVLHRTVVDRDEGRRRRPIPQAMSFSVQGCREGRQGRQDHVLEVDVGGQRNHGTRRIQGRIASEGHEIHEVGRRADVQHRGEHELVLRQRDRFLEPLRHREGQRRRTGGLRLVLGRGNADLVQHLTAHIADVLPL